MTGIKFDTFQKLSVFGILLSKQSKNMTLQKIKLNIPLHVSIRKFLAADLGSSKNKVLRNKALRKARTFNGLILEQMEVPKHIKGVFSNGFKRINNFYRPFVQFLFYDN